MNGLYLKNGRVVDVVNGRVHGGDVGIVIQDGKIFALPGLPGEPECPAGCRTLDLKSRFVLPGLFNTHCHLQLVNGLLGHAELKLRQMEKNMSDCLQAGITNIRDAWAPNLSINRAVVDRISAGSLPGPRVQQCVVVCPEGNWCAPKPNAFNRMLMSIVDYDLPASGTVTFRPDASDGEVCDAVDRAVDERGADCIKFYDQYEKFMTYKPGGIYMSDDQIAAAADQARKRGVPTTAHHTKVRLFRRDVACGVDSLAHMPADLPLTEEDIAAFLSSGCHIEPTLSVSYGLGWSGVVQDHRSSAELQALEAFRRESFAGFADRYWLPELAGIYLKNFTKYDNGNFRMMGLFDMSAPSRHYTKGFDNIIGNMRLLYAAGKSRFACGNDATVAFYTQAAIQLEFALLKLYLKLGTIEADPADLLRIATIQSARAMKLEDRFGSIETGKIADLVVLDGNPLQDTSLFGSKAAAVFKDGKLAVDNCSLGR